MRGTTLIGVVTLAAASALGLGAAASSPLATSDNVIDRHIWAKLEADPAEPRHLLTEPGVGYRLAAQ